MHMHACDAVNHVCIKGSVSVATHECAATDCGSSIKLFFVH